MLARRFKPWLAWRHSLGARLVLLFALLALASSAIFVSGVQKAFGANWRVAVRPLIDDYVDRLAADIGSPPDVAKAQALTARLPLALRIEGPVVNWVSNPQAPGLAGMPMFMRHPMAPPPLAADAANDATPDNATAATTTAAEAPAWAGAHPGSTAAPGHGGPPWREGRPHRRRFAVAPEHAWLARSTADGHILQFALDIEGWASRSRSIGAATLALLLALLALAWWLVRRWLIQPLLRIGSGAQRFGRGDFSQPIVLQRPDELGALAGQVNRMAADLSSMLEGQRQLLLAISHELRSPLTRARLHAELLDEGGERSALLRDLGQMRDLIADLLESERLARPDSALQREATDGPALAALVASVRAELHPAFPQAEPQLNWLAPADLAQWPSGWVDRTRLALLLRNLLSNAWRHAAQAPTPPELRLAWEPAASGTSNGDPNGSLLMSLRDYGPGVAPEHLARLAEPFYRPDSARTRSAGGVGLGLHLCRQVAQAHGGRLEVALAEPGLRVSVRLPWPGAAGGAYNPTSASATQQPNNNPTAK